MIEVSASIRIGCSVDEAFAVIADMSRNPEWQNGMRSCTWTSDPPIGVGSTYDQTAAFLGRTIRSSFTVVEFDPPRRIRIKSTESTFPLDVTRTVSPEGDGARVEALVRGEPGRFAMMFKPLLRSMVRRSVRGDYERLKRLLDDGVTR